MKENFISNIKSVFVFYVGEGPLVPKSIGAHLIATNINTWCTPFLYAIFQIISKNQGNTAYLNA